jgi:hypothetical protein
LARFILGGSSQENLVELSGQELNQVFDDLADWEQILKDSSLARPRPPAP